MTDYRPFSLYKAKVYYTDDLTSYKWRPVIILDEVAYSVLPVTSVMTHWGYVIKDWQKAKLDSPSLIKTEEYLPISPQNIGGYIGDLTDRDVYDFAEFIDLFPP